jgi:prolipoprotein diacylglyceryl transferase
VLASIPSPESGVIDVGPLPIHFYGLMLAIGVLVAAKVTERRWRRMGGDPALVGEIALWVVVAGVIGARVYHLFTGYDWDEEGIVGTLKIWEGGLSIWGAVGGGFIAVLVLARTRRFDLLAMCDAIAPGLALAQAIGRWGNWFNQELFGRPTDLPWALQIDMDNRPLGFASYETFHPTFLYESLWMFAVAGALVLVERRYALRRGQTLALYVMLYTSFRVFMEYLRIDEATKILGLRFNAVLSVVLCAGALAAFVWLARHGRPADAPLQGGGREAAPPGERPAGVP